MEKFPVAIYAQQKKSLEDVYPLHSKSFSVD